MSRRRSEQTWRELVTRQVDSGVSVQAFCGDLLDHRLVRAAEDQPGRLPDLY